MELLRIAIGLPVAAIFPLGIPTVNSKQWLAVGFSTAYATIVLLPMLSSWRGWALLVFAVLVALALGKSMRVNKITKEPSGRTPWGQFLVGKIAFVVCTALFVAIVSVMLMPDISLGASLAALLMNDRTVVICNGYIGAMFAGDLVVSHAVGPLLDRLPKNDSYDATALSNAGAHIGWIERALFFPLFAGGAAAAAAIAFTAKSLVRLPGLHDNSHKNMAEYVLVGGMLSALVALVFAIITRLALGMSPI